MKELSLVRTKNVREAEKMVNYLLNRPKTEMVGLGLIYGEPGLGKSRFARQTAIRDDYIYMRLESTMTAKSFSIRLLELVQYHFGMTRTQPRGTTNDVFNQVINTLRMHDNTVIAATGCSGTACRSFQLPPSFALAEASACGRCPPASSRSWARTTSSSSATKWPRSSSARTS